jgi:hypothetical protein
VIVNDLLTERGGLFRRRSLWDVLLDVDRALALPLETPALGLESSGLSSLGISSPAVS